MRVLHNNIFHIAKFFDRFCKKHGLNYYLLGGTALGAERHGGFIPWDDDFDVCMVKSDYRRLLELAGEFEGTDFYLQAENTNELPLFFSKVRLHGSQYYEHDDFDKEMHHGVYIDVMCLAPSYSNKFLTYLQYLASKLLSAKALKKRGYRNATISKKLLMILSYLLPGVNGSFMLSFARNDFSFKDGDCHVHFFGRAPFSKGIIKNYHLLTDTVNFEGYVFDCFSDNRGYLITRFGDDCFLPPSDRVLSSFPAHCTKFVSHPDLDFDL